ncbi:hypothetical protein [Ramlibacter rhizophilus]|uniref:Uncharacterized protein n=1 Tax=Ramlibacter rhizophilus TaxID=1781167 RepID=A0A4Z0BDP9_9BURK|nr:hypothetical protein [Ramlibacter rhizophilus]TFY96244.1 hypothetical protein EZ242_21600 [Ramlibacter rhizophilus]
MSPVATASPVDQVYHLVTLANQRPRDAAAVAASIDQLTALQRRHPDRLQPLHVLSAAAGLGLGALPPATREAVETLGAQIVRLGETCGYPWDECALALLELARLAPPRLSLAERINVTLAFKRRFDALGEASQGKFTAPQVSAYKDKLGSIAELALDDSDHALETRASVPNTAIQLQRVSS